MEGQHVTAASSARNAGESAICPGRAQPSAEIVRRAREMQARARFVPCCRDRACRAREMQARVRFVRYPRNPAQPSAEIVRVESAKCKRECDCSGARVALYGDRTCRAREMQATRRGVPCARVSGKLEDENWRVQF